MAEHCPATSLKSAETLIDIDDRVVADISSVSVAVRTGFARPRFPPLARHRTAVLPAPPSAVFILVVH